MSLSDLNLPLAAYDSDSIDIYNEIVVPAYNESIQYDRSVGYLTNSFIRDALFNLDIFSETSAKINFLIGDPLERAVLKAITSNLSNETLRDLRRKTALTFVKN